MPAFAVQVQGVHDALLTHSGEAGTIYVARMAMALLRSPDLKGQRSIEAASGLSRDTVFDHLPGEGETSYGLLKCIDRGSQNTYEDQHVGQYVVTGNIPNALSQSSIKTGTSSTTGGTSSTVPIDRTQGVRDLAGVLAEGRERLLDPRVLEALDPARDVWAPRSLLAAPLDYRGAGHRGWALGLLLGLADVTLTYAQVRELLGLSERQTRNIVTQLEEAGLVDRRVVGRMTLLDFTFASTLVETHSMRFFNDADRAERAHHKREHHHRERTLLASRKTRHGREAWLLVRYPNPHWSPETLRFYSPANELVVAAMFERSMKRLVLAA